MASNNLNADLRRGDDAPISVHLPDNDHEGDSTLVGTLAAEAAADTSVLEIPSTPTGGEVWTQTMIDIKGEGVNDVVVQGEEGDDGPVVHVAANFQPVVAQEPGAVRVTQVNNRNETPPAAHNSSTPRKAGLRNNSRGGAPTSDDQADPNNNNNNNNNEWSALDIVDQSDPTAGGVGTDRNTQSNNNNTNAASTNGDVSLGGPGAQQQEEQDDLFLAQATLVRSTNDSALDGEIVHADPQDPADKDKGQEDATNGQRTQQMLAMVIVLLLLVVIVGVVLVVLMLQGEEPKAISDPDMVDGVQMTPPVGNVTPTIASEEVSQPSPPIPIDSSASSSSSSALLALNMDEILAADASAPRPHPLEEGVPIHSVDYRAQVARVMDPGCHGPNADTIALVCPKGRIQVLATSNDNAISCSSPNGYDNGAGEVSICAVTCPANNNNSNTTTRQRSLLLSSEANIAGDSSHGSKPSFAPKGREGDSLRQTSRLQQASSSSGPRFQISYLARFQHLADSACSGPVPTIQLICGGSIVPLTRSDSGVECTAISSGMECTVECGGTFQPACSTIYLEDSGVAGGQFGEVAYRCQGDSVRDVDSYMVYTNSSGVGSCRSTTASTSRNYHVAQLGVFCPNEGRFGDGAYVFDDLYFECGLGNNPAKYDGIYTCLEGTRCERDACTVRFNELRISADSHKFYSCIEALNGATIPDEPTVKELISPADAGTYSATFQANWQLNLDTSSCAGDFAKKRLTCTNGDIEFIDALASNVDCTTIGSDAIECEDTSDANFVNEFSGAIFRCTSNNFIPEASASYLSADSLCENGGGNTVAHYIQLGVQCTDASDDQYTSYNDFFFECDDENSYDFVDGVYTCISENTFGSGAIPYGEITELSVASIHTDFRWSHNQFDGCYTVTASSPAQTPSGPSGGGVLGVGTPPIASPAQGPSQGPTGRPTRFPTNRPSPRPSPRPTRRPSSNPTTLGPTSPAPTDHPTPVPTQQPTPSSMPPSQGTATAPEPELRLAGQLSLQLLGISSPFSRRGNTQRIFVATANEFVSSSAVGQVEDVLVAIVYQTVIVDPSPQTRRRRWLQQSQQQAGVLQVDLSVDGWAYDELLSKQDWNVWLYNLFAQESAEFVVQLQNASRAQDDDFFKPLTAVVALEPGTAIDQGECHYIDRTSSSSSSSNDGKYATIDFRCTSDATEGVDGAIVLPGSEEGNCSDGGGLQNLLVAQLQVSCPNDESGSFQFTNETTACSTPSPSSPQISHECSTGGSCEDEACTVMYQDVIVAADHQRFPQCLVNGTSSGG